MRAAHGGSWALAMAGLVLGTVPLSAAAVGAQGPDAGGPRRVSAGGGLLAIDAGGSRLVVGGGDDVRVIDSDGGPLPALPPRFESAEFTQDGLRLIGAVNVDPSSGEEISGIRLAESSGFDSTDITPPDLIAGFLRLDVSDISDDGTVVAVVGYPAAGSGGTRAFVWDRTSGAVTPLDTVVTPEPGATRSTDAPALDGSGRYVAFNVTDRREACRICTDVWLLDRHTGATSKITATTDGLPPSMFVGPPEISGDGRWVFFASNSTNIVLDNPSSGEPWMTDVRPFAFDRYAGVVQELAAPGADLAQGAIESSDDGSTLAFIGNAPTTSSTGVSIGWQAVVLHRTCAVAEVVSAPVGELPDGQVNTVRLSHDGSTVAFVSSAHNIGVLPTEANATFVADVVGCQRDYVPLQPQRLADSRTNGGPVAAGVVFRFRVAGRYTVASDAMAVALNVTVSNTAGAGYLTVWPCSGPPPNASNVNYVAGRDVPNMVMAALSPSGDVCIRVAESAAAVIVDLNGYVPAAAAYSATQPMRFLDTRAGGQTIDDGDEAGGIVAPGTTVRVRVAGRGGVAAIATAAVLNVTSTGGMGAGYLTIWPCDTAEPPNASSLNYQAGVNVPNLVQARLSPAGDVCIRTAQAAAHVIVDVNGYLTSESSYVSLTPTRVLDSRPGGATADQRFAGMPTVRAGHTVMLEIPGRLGVPVDVEAVALNVTAAGGSGAGFVTIWPCTDPAEGPPSVSSLNFATADVANAVIAPISWTGVVCLRTQMGASDLVVDLVGYFPAP